MKIPMKYIVRSLFARRLTTAITIFGVSLVVFVFTAVLMMSDGIRQTLRGTGSSENVLIARKAANGEISSIITSNTYGVISSLPKIARGADGKTPIRGEAAGCIEFAK